MQYNTTALAYSMDISKYAFNHPTKVKLNNNKLYSHTFVMQISQNPKTYFALMNQLREDELEDTSIGH